MMLPYLSFVFLALIHGSYSANILGLMNVASPSHSIWNNVLLDALAESGHNVTVIISDLPRGKKDVHKNITYYTVNEVYEQIHDEMDISSMFDISAVQMATEFCTYCALNCEATLNSKGLDTFLKTYDRSFKFDLILYDYTCGPCLVGLLERFNYPPLVGVSAFPIVSFGNSFIGGDYHPGYITYHSAFLSPTELFVDRLYNNFLYLYESMLKRYSFYPDLDKMVRQKHFSGLQKTVGELEKFVTISLVNSHPAISPAEPVPPNLIEVGGLQLVDPDVLPKDLEDFVSSSVDGAVFFSMGTNVRPEDMTENHVEIFLSVMKKLPKYNFLWKFDAAKIKTEIPKNVFIRNFFPQRDILAHPKVKGFISHCGGLSTQESIWYGVPMIGLPLFADQFRNLRDAAQKNIAVHVEFSTITAHSFEKGLREVLENPKYMKSVKLLSQRFRDRQAKPLDTAVWWIEYILRNPNPEHLKPKSLKMNYLAASSIDFILVILLGSLIVVGIMAAALWCCCCSTAKNKSVQKKHKAQ